MLWTIVDNTRHGLRVLDREALYERVGGDEEFLQEIAGLFLEDCPKLLSDIQSAVTAGNARALQHAAHTLKGSVANFGAEAARHAALRLEVLGREGNLRPAADAYSDLVQEIGRFTNALDSLARELSSR